MQNRFKRSEVVGRALPLRAKERASTIVTFFFARRDARGADGRNIQQPNSA